MSTQQSGLVAANKQNEAGGATGKNRSTFPLSYSFFSTERFAEYTPFYVQEGVSTDRLPLHSNHEVQTYTLKSPILQSLAKKKDYFMVPMQAILPLNWEKFYTQPNIGEDVPVDSGCGVQLFWKKLRYLFLSSASDLKTEMNVADWSADDAPDPGVVLTHLFRFLLFFEQIYSTGSLMETLGISGHNWFRCWVGEYESDGSFKVYDEFFDSLMAGISNSLAASDSYLQLQIGDDIFVITASPDDDVRNYNYTPISLREGLELMRDDLSFSITAFYEDGLDESSTLVDALYAVYSTFHWDLYESDAPLNLARLWAYQLVCAHYYSNDHVDFIYSAELYRQYIADLAYLANDSAETIFPSFVVNSIRYQYDYLSAHYFSNVLDALSVDGIFYDEGTELYPSLAYFTALFSFKRSLRFVDYFTGARTRPLAVGDTKVDVNAGKVDIIDLSRSSMMTKFLQAVNRSGRKFGAYMQELFGKTPVYDYHNPMYLAHTSDLVGSQETENTGEAQVTDKLAVTSRLRASSSRYAFEFVPDRDAIIIGISYYDLPRVYTRATERQAFILDRFDYFNQYLQFIGDQPIWQAEIGTDSPSYGDPSHDTPFGYQNRDMQWKQRFNQACGGFCVPSTGLDNWIFPADTLRRRNFHRISPSFIRSFNSEIDRFFQSLTGFSLGTYFHFIVRYDNRMNASRPMAYNPTINL